MRRILTIARLTLISAFRFKVVMVLILLLGLMVLGLPFLIKHNGTAEAFIQVYLTYTLGIIATLLGLSTLWISCASLSQDIEECYLQMIVTKPIARWQVWVGKWMGILILNGFLLALASTISFLFMLAQAKKLPDEEWKTLQNEIFVARNGLTEPSADRQDDIERILTRRLQELSGSEEVNPSFVREQVEDYVRSLDELVQPAHMRMWSLNVGSRLSPSQPGSFQIRVKFHAARANDTGLYRILWRIQNGTWQSDLHLSPDRFHEINVPYHQVPSDGKITFECVNLDQVTLLFPLEDGFELLYPDGSFTLNYARGIGIIFAWLAALAALGLAAASLLTFPVATFATLCVLVAIFSGNVVRDIAHDETLGVVEHEDHTNETVTFLDPILVPVFKGIASLMDQVELVSPIHLLSSGRSIGWDKLGLTFSQMFLLCGIPLAGIGIYCLNRRELALWNKA